jgi:hypothetical protein
LSLSRDVSLATGLVEIFPFGSTTEGASGATCAISITDNNFSYRMTEEFFWHRHKCLSTWEHPEKKKS